MSARARVAITGSGLISSLGTSPRSLHAALMRGETGRRPIEAFDASGLPSGPGLNVHGLDAQGFEVHDFEPREFLGDGNLRPLDRTALLAASAAALALDDAGWNAERRADSAVGLAMGTMFCSVHTISEFDRRGLIAGPQYVKPLSFANSVLNAAAGQTAIWHGLTGVNSTLGGGATAGLAALAYGADLVRSGRGRAVLAGGAEELCFESYFGFIKAGLLAGSANGAAPCAVPFEGRRNGFLPGEGAAFLMLEPLEAALLEGATVHAEIRGHGSAFDLSQGTDPASAASAVERAIRAALLDAEIGAEEIDVASLSANGSPSGDRAEAMGFAAALGARIEKVPVTAPKSMLGESMGAAGALATAALLLAMQEEELPGILGLEDPEPGLPPLSATPEARHAILRTGLLTAVGFDGNATALIVEKA